MNGKSRYATQIAGLLAGTFILAHIPVRDAGATDVVCPPASQVQGYVREAAQSRILANTTPARYSNVDWAVQHRSYDGIFPILAKATRFTQAVLGDGTLRCHYDGEPIGFVLEPQPLFGQCKALKGFRKTASNTEVCDSGTTTCVAVCE